MTQRELKERIKEDPNLTQGEKARRLNELRQPYRALSDEELLQLVRDFTEENGREPMQADVLYDSHECFVNVFDSLCETFLSKFYIKSYAIYYTTTKNKNH